MPLMHERFSRWIGPLPRQETGVVGWLVLAALSLALLYMLIAHPIGTISVLAALTAMSVVMERKRSRHVQTLTTERAGEDIGTFARAFDRRGGEPIDPWAIRAVWNALSPLTESNGRLIPLRPTDRFEADLSIDPEDIEDLMTQIVRQCERVPGNWTANPYYHRLHTVADMVYFVSAQPLRRSE